MFCIKYIKTHTDTSDCIDAFSGYTQTHTFNRYNRMVKKCSPKLIYLFILLVVSLWFLSVFDELLRFTFGLCACHAHKYKRFEQCSGYSLESIPSHHTASNGSWCQIFQRTSSQTHAQKIPVYFENHIFRSWCPLLSYL